MVKNTKEKCPFCGGDLQPRGKVKRVIRVENGRKKTIHICRFSCKKCGRWHRVLPEKYIPYKQYTKNVIEGFKTGLISDANLEWENYPCDMTKKRWSHDKHSS